MVRPLGVLTLATLLAAIAAGQEVRPETLAVWAGYSLEPPSGAGWKFVSVEEGEAIAVRAQNLARERLRTFPNFLCEMPVQRLRSRIRSGVVVQVPTPANSGRVRWLRTMGEILAEVRFADGIEEYRVVSIGGKRTNESFHAGKGTGKGVLISENEFVGLLGVIADPAVQFRLHRSAAANGNPVHVFRVTVPKSIGHWVRREGYPGGRVDWEGFVYVHRDSEHVLAIVLESVDIPRSYGIVKSCMSVFYGSAEIDGEPYLLPVASESLSVNPGSLPAVRQSSRYRNYRKFEAESELQFEDVDSKLTFPRR